MATCYRHLYMLFMDRQLRQDERTDKPIEKFARRTISERVRVLKIAATIQISIPGDPIMTKTFFLGEDKESKLKRRPSALYDNPIGFYCDINVESKTVPL